MHVFLYIILHMHVDKIIIDFFLSIRSRVLICIRTRFVFECTVERMHLLFAMHAAHVF